MNKAPSITLLTAIATLAGACRFEHLAGEEVAFDGGARDAAAAGGAGGSVVTPGTGGALATGGTTGLAGKPGTGGSDAGGALPTEEDVVPLGGPATGWPIALTVDQVATRLAAFLWNAAPDEALLRFVTSRAPRTNVDVGSIADAMLVDARATGVVSRFYDWWMDLQKLELGLTKDAALAPWFTPQVAALMRTQIHDFASRVTWAPDGSLARLLLDSEAPVPDALLPAFRGAAQGPGPVRALDPADYAGIWSLPAPNAILASQRYENPVRRGLAIRTRLLCEGIPPSPAPITPVEPTATGQTMRQKLAEVSAQPQCKACHALLDPVGFAFNQFDAAGGFRLNDVDGRPVDASGELGGSSDDPAGSFFGAPGLMKLVARHVRTQTCFSAHWLGFALGRRVEEIASTTFDDPASVYVRKRAQIAGELNLRGVLRAVVETHPFLAP